MSTKPETITKATAAAATKPEPATTQTAEKPVRQPIARMSVARVAVFLPITGVAQVSKDARKTSWYKFLLAH